MTEDMTFCINGKCKVTKCVRHQSHIRLHNIPHSFGFFKNCNQWNMSEEEVKKVLGGIDVSTTTKI